MNAAVTILIIGLVAGLCAGFAHDNLWGGQLLASPVTLIGAIGVLVNLI